MEDNSQSRIGLQRGAEIDTFMGNWPKGRLLIDASTRNRHGSEMRIYMDGKLEVDSYIPFPCMISRVYQLSIREKPQSIVIELDGTLFEVDMETVR